MKLEGLTVVTIIEGFWRWFEGFDGGLDILWFNS